MATGRLVLEVEGGDSEPFKMSVEVEAESRIGVANVLRAAFAASAETPSYVIFPPSEEHQQEAERIGERLRRGS
jgi:hypothetical protein